jgi:Predicted integral membrane protein (DUF2269)
MPSLFVILLFLHVAAAIMAFGPSYATPMVMNMVAEEPEHRGFVSRMNLAISRKFTTPLALSMALTGVLMIWVRSYPLLPWLVLSIALYVFLVGWSLLVQQPSSTRIIDRMAELRASGAPPGPPPPDVVALITRTRRGGKMLGMVTLAILALMIWKPVF